MVAHCVNQKPEPTAFLLALIRDCLGLAQFEH